MRGSVHDDLKLCVTDLRPIVFSATELDRHRFIKCANRTFVDSIFITVAFCWFDVRQKQLQSALRTATSGNRWQWGRIRAIWLWHGAPPFLYRRERDWSLSHRHACRQSLGRG